MAVAVTVRGETILVKYNNRLLEALLLASDLGPHVSGLTIQSGDVLIRAHELLEYVFFPEDCGLAVGMIVSGKLHGQVVMIGSEGAAGVMHILRGVTAPVTVAAFTGGVVNRLPVEKLASLLRSNPAATTILQGYASALFYQLSDTAYANSAASASQRLCRWLLMASDRCGPRIGITHSALATLLSLHRPGLSALIATLVEAGMLGQERGRLIVLDRARLIQECRGFYGKSEAEYDRLLGGLL